MENASRCELKNTLASAQHHSATYNNQSNRGKLVGGPITGGTVNQGDTYDTSQYISNTINPSGGNNLATHITATTVHFNQHNDATSQQPSSSSASSPQPRIRDLPKPSLKVAQQSLKEMYLTRFQKVRPFSLPFMFDIENTWVSLALKEEGKDSQATEDHGKLLEQAFRKTKMLTIEGDPATGKTSLMRRLAYEWARQKNRSKFEQLKNWVGGKFLKQEDEKGLQLVCYDLVLYAEFREVREKTFESIAELVLYYYSKNYITRESYENLKNLITNEKFSKESRILVLLDGYDESSLEKQCLELNFYINENMVYKALLFNTVITTRKGYLSTHRDVKKGRLVFAEVLGFSTMTQKEKYISNHFFSEKIDNKEQILTVHSLLANNKNLNKLAETPLFLTFICLVYEKIVDGTLLELYCNIIRWLIDRHQQDFPNSDVPALFDYQSDSVQASKPIKEKQTTIRNHYLQFPQLLALGKMALFNLKKDIFQETDFTVFNIKSIVQQVGLIRKDEFFDQSWNPTTTYSFPHRTIQELLAAFYCICSNDPTREWLLPNSTLDTAERDTHYHLSGMNEFERFLFRIALSDKMPIQAEKRKYYFDRITDINLDITFDAFNTTAGFNNKLLSWFLSQCTNVQNIKVNGIMNRVSHEWTKLNDASVHNESAVASKMSISILSSFSNLIKLRSLTFSLCTFATNCQLSFTNCPFLKHLIFWKCEMKRSTIVGIETLPVIDSVRFLLCNIDMATWQSTADQISNSSVKYLQLIFGGDFNKEFLIHLQKCNNIEQMEITIKYYIFRQNDLLSFSDLIKLLSLSFGHCRFSANSQLSFTNCPSLKNLKFDECEMKSSTNLGIATLPAIDTVKFDGCNIDLAIWQSITDQINNSNVTCLHLPADFFVEELYPEFLHHVHKCERIQQIHVNDVWDSNSSPLDIIYILCRHEESVAANLALTAQKLPALTSITISNKTSEGLDESSRMSKRNKQRIEKAGQQRNPHFCIKYVDDPDSKLE